MAARKRGKERATAGEQPERAPRPKRAVSASQPSARLSTSPAAEDISASERGGLKVPVAGLVASAGGLDAFKKFFSAMPADSGIAFVLIPHLDPEHESLVVELLARHTSMPGVEAAEGIAVLANRVYIIPPNKNTTISGGNLRLSGPVERGNWQTSIDLFLRSLADERQEKAICIILSGTGSHGTLGLTAVKAAGGMAMVQDPKSAGYPPVPGKAIATVLADYVLPVEQMPEALVKYVQHGYVSGGRRAAAVDEIPDHLNEELSTVNSQLHDKVVEVESARNDMADLLNATHIATVFLDAGLRIRLFTPPATRIFKMIASDVGRPIGDLATRFTDLDSGREAQDVLRDLTPREKEVPTEDGRWCVRRIMPYRTLDNRIDGVVITFVDITERKQAADAVTRHLAAVVENSVDAIFSKDLEGTIRTWNDGAERLYGYSGEEALGRSVKMLVPEDRFAKWTEVMATLARGEHVEQLETERIRKDGERGAAALTISPIRDSDGKVVSASVTGRDITRRKELEREVVEIASLEQRRIGQDLHDSVSQELAALNMLSVDLAETLRSGPAKASQLVERIVLGLQRSQQELRAVMRGLLPVSVDAEGLMFALSDLADRTTQKARVTCDFDCPKAVPVDDNVIATHLYLISQEAVHSAIKHARCRNIRISVVSNQFLVLRVQDDGIGISDQPADNRGGLGLGIMRNRSAIIRATFTIEPAKPAGTVVTCALARKNHE
jgi:PAS domain S-box-containing protein